MNGRRWLGCAFIVSGALAVAGALLPWLTLYAGLYQYSGTVGLYGRIVLAAGLPAIGAGIISLRAPAKWQARTGLVYGLMLLAFAFWLYAGLNEIVRRPESAMLVVRAGPGVFVVLVGAAIMVISSASCLLQGAVTRAPRRTLSHGGASGNSPNS